MDTQPIVSQPGVGSNYVMATGDCTNPPADGITVRHMTPDDAEFVARCLVKGFQAKVEYHITRDKVEPLIGLISQAMSNLAQHAPKKLLIGCYYGKPAGIALINFDTNRASPGDESIPYFSVLGCCNAMRISRCTWWDPPLPDGHMVLDAFTVMDEFRGKGIGKALLVAVDNCAREANRQAVSLYCAYENPALRLYLRHGYVEDQFISGSCRAKCASGVSKWHFLVKQV